MDIPALTAHVTQVMGWEGIRGLLINGQAGENAQLSRSQKRQVVQTVRAALPGALLICGAFSESALAAADHARDVADAGATRCWCFRPTTGPWVSCPRR